MKSQRILELELQYQQEDNAKLKVDLLTEMGIEARTYDTDLALAYAQQIIADASQIDYIKGIGKGYNLKGSVLSLHGEYEEGTLYLNDAMKIAKQVGDNKLLARAQINLGNAYRDQGDFSNALNYYDSALKINEELGNDALLAVNLNSIANLWYELGDYDTALQYALKCLPILVQSNSQNRIVDLYITLGNIYFKKETYAEARQYFEQVMEMVDKQSSSYLLAWSGVGKVCYKIGDFENAIAILKEALIDADNGEFAEVQIICRYYLGLIYLQDESFRKAKLYLEEAYDMARDYSRKHDMMTIHEALSNLYDKMGNVPKAFEHLKSYESLKEDIFTQTTFYKLRNLQIQQATELAKKEREVAERTAHLKQQFMANMSHEIRTPMNAIVGMTRLLMEKNPKAEQMRYLNAISQSADNLLVIINDILDLSKIEAGKIVIEYVPLKLRVVLESVRDMLMLRAEEKQLWLKIKVADDVPDDLIGDPTRLNQILVNLVGNAIKFTEQGGVIVQVTREANSANKFDIRFEVIDTGIGISEDYVNKIFDSFTQAGTDTARKFGGTGLGLTISKELTKLMGGQISVESTLGAGTTFILELPFEENNEVLSAQDGKLLEQAAKEQLKGISVLLVEDNEFNRMVAEDTLRETIDGIAVDIAVNGAEALQKVQEQNYDVVLMDIQMPVMDGMQATKAIRALDDAVKSQVNIIAMTANVLQDDVKKYFELGMNGYVSKPFQPVELLQKIAQVINETPQATPSHKETAKVNRFAKPLPERVTDMSFLKQLTGGDTSKMNKYVNMFLENGPKLLVNIKAALQQGDYASLKIAAHSLKPQLGYMGVKEEVSNVFMLEQAAGEQGHYEKIPELVDNLQMVTEKSFEELKSLQLT